MSLVQQCVVQTYSGRVNSLILSHPFSTLSRFAINFMSSLLLGGGSALEWLCFAVSVMKALDMLSVPPQLVELTVDTFCLSLWVQTFFSESPFA